LCVCVEMGMDMCDRVRIIEWEEVFLM